MQQQLPTTPQLTSKIMTNIRRKFLILPAFFLLFWFFSQKAEALTLSPARFEIETDAGNTVTGEITLLNEQSEAKTFYSSFENFEANGDTGTPNFVPGKDGLASWISADYSVTLNPGEEKKLNFSIKVPPNAKPGGYFAALFWGTNPVASDDVNISVGARIGMLVLLRVSGEVKEGGGIGEIDTESGEVLFDKLPVTLTYVFTNDGDDRLNPKGLVTVRNLFGIKVSEMKANPTDGNVLPRSSRKYQVIWGKEQTKNGFFHSALYQVKHFAIGPYKITIDLAYGATGELSDKESKFIWFLPWQILLIVFILLLFIWAIFVKIVKTRRRLLRRQRELERKIRELEQRSQVGVSPVKNLPRRLNEIKNSRTIAK